VGRILAYPDRYRRLDVKEILRAEMIYSARKATTGSTFVARRAGK
jgi:hypothetical protein